MMTRILFQIVPLRRNPIRDRTDTWPVLILLLLDKFLCIFNRILCSNYKYLFHCNDLPFHEVYAQSLSQDQEAESLLWCIHFD